MRFLFVFLVFSCLALPAIAQSPNESTPAQHINSESVLEMDTMVVTGAQPGPGMWKVSRGDHSLWVLGTLSPLPSGISWKADEVKAVLEQADQVLGSPGLVVDADIGVFKGLMLLPSALKAGKNPDGKTLKDVLPADVYARWLALKPRYFGRDKGIEKKRPVLVANELYAAANRKAGLGRKPVITPVIDEVLKRRKMKITPTMLKITIEDPKAAIKEFTREGVNDLECFRLALDRVENDIPLMVDRANAWSVGDLDALRILPSEKQAGACMSALASGEFARKRGMGDVEARVRAQWLKTAEEGLQKNRVTFATLPIAELQKPDGYLSYLQAKGYVVEAPL
ncbi:MAG TPA: TraB/GumN family protein [Pseudoxanthomonas sp.]|nr:TraB/GumN family protein [Pseudoxanthomonas sp.]